MIYKVCKFLMNKENLVILNNEKVFKENGNFFLDNLDLKVIPEGLNQFFNVKFISIDLFY